MLTITIRVVLLYSADCAGIIPYYVCQEDASLVNATKAVTAMIIPSMVYKDSNILHGVYYAVIIVVRVILLVTQIISLMLKKKSIVYAIYSSRFFKFSAVLYGTRIIYVHDIYTVYSIWRGVIPIFPKSGVYRTVQYSTSNFTPYTMTANHFPPVTKIPSHSTAPSNSHQIVQ